MTPDKLSLNLSLLNGGSDSAILIGYSPIMEYDKENRKRTDRQIGILYEVVLDRNGYEKLSVKVGDLKPAISMEALQDANAVRCTFKGFNARFYKDFRSGEYRLTASSDSIILVNDEDEDLLA
ncbi:hypothetical protein [Lacrimispora sp.]|uniref:hypothetical protein n=1 Tax=Lacrimispora sp. TaxID=2719234 RepID=UPI0028B041B4|nr:hypothetical protein [Lacrimispora sp.]